MAASKEASGLTRKRVCLEIMEAIAAEKVALARVIGVEGDKIERIVCLLSAKPDDLLAVNRSAESMLGTIARLENTLTEQLEWLDYQLTE